MHINAPTNSCVVVVGIEQFTFVKPITVHEAQLLPHDGHCSPLQAATIKWFLQNNIHKKCLARAQNIIHPHANIHCAIVEAIIATSTAQTSAVMLSRQRARKRVRKRWNLQTWWFHSHYILLDDWSDVWEILLERHAQLMLFILCGEESQCYAQLLNITQLSNYSQHFSRIWCWKSKQCNKFIDER